LLVFINATLFCNRVLFVKEERKSSASTGRRHISLKERLKDYKGDYKTEEVLDICFDGILLHDFGGWIIEDGLAKPEELNSLKDFRDALYEKLK